MHKEQVDGCKTKALCLPTVFPLLARLAGPATSDGSYLIFRVCQRAQLIQAICGNQILLIWGPLFWEGFFFNFNFLLLFSYSCMPFLPVLGGFIKADLIPSATALVCISTACCKSEGREI